MPRIEKADGGIYVYDVAPLPDGTFIPYNYNPTTDDKTPPEIKQMVVQILNYVAEQESMGGASYMEQTGAPEGSPRASSTKFRAMEHMDNKAMGLLTKRWGWLDKQDEPPDLYTRGQRYTKKPRSKPIKKTRKKTTKTTPKRISGTSRKRGKK
jgi:hypothetical protein